MAESRRAVGRTIRSAAEALRPFADPTRLGLESARAALADPPPPDSVDAWVARMDGVLKEVGPLLEPVEQVPPAERGDEEKALLAARDVIRFAAAEGRLFSAKAAELRTDLGGKVILLGGTATSLGDIVPTSVHPQCPGVVVHGAVLNALLTGNFWTAAPGWVTGLVTLCMGLAVTGAKVRLGPWPALAVTVGLVGGYAVVNGLVLFDYGDRIVGLAGPLVVGAVVWALLTLTSHLLERQERARITRRFKRYVDPAVVNYMLAHPELDALAGEVREMTVAFTDLAGYTSLTERLRERAVRILGRYKTLMVPVIRRHRGLIHAFLGDGIMISYGAPEPNAEHAACAVATAFDIQRATATFNAELAADGHDPVTTRVGICTGPAVVGDSGSDEGADYACLGNTTNLAARLESANKAVGTTIMISGRTAELLGGTYLLRPIARMVVKGKTEWVMTYEPLAKADEATADQRRLATLTADMVDAFAAGRLGECVLAAARLEAAFGPSKLAALYRDACDQCRDGPPPGFEGQIVLREK
jgi:adenylate cyclase